MKFIHLSDLHLGKRLGEFSLLEDQAYILEQILGLIDLEQPQGVLLAGDIYDKSVPTAEAVRLFDEFLYSLARRGLQVFVISGNHDSPERIAFASRLLGVSGVHLSPVYQGTVTPVTLEDQYGLVDVYLLPFLKPAHVRRFFPDREIDSYTDALEVAISQMAPDPNRRNVLVTHQFVTGAARSESEEITVGGSDNVDARVFAGFDYVALGHIHGPQNIGSPRLRYCGTPLKYSFSEAGQEKSVTVVTLSEPGALEVRTLPLAPLRDLRELRGSYLEVTNRAACEGSNREDYLHIILTDEEDIPEGMSKLRLFYPNVMKLDYDNHRTRSDRRLQEAEDPARQSPLALFESFYAQQNGQPMSPDQTAFSAKLMEQIWEGNL